MCPYVIDEGDESIELRLCRRGITQEFIECLAKAGVSIRIGVNYLNEYSLISCENLIRYSPALA